MSGEGHALNVGLILGDATVALTGPGALIGFALGWAMLLLILKAAK